MSDKGKVFKTRLTVKAAMYGAIPLTSALVLMHFALDAARKFHPSDPSRIFFVGIPALISLGILVALAIVCKTYLGRKIGVKGSDLMYKDSKHMMNLKIEEMAYSPPAHKAMVRTLMFSDGVAFVQIPELFMNKAEFEELVQHIRARRQDNDMASQRTYSV